MASSIFVTAASPGHQALRLCGASSAAKENITISGATPSPFALRIGPQKPKNVMQITYAAALSSYVPDHEMHPSAKERDYHLEFRPHERAALRNSRHAACDGVDLRSRVRREPRRSGMPAAKTRPGRY